MSEPDDHPDHPDSTDDAVSPREKPMGFWDHLEELRGVIIKSVIVFIVFASIIGYYLSEFNSVLMYPFNKVVHEYPGLVVKLGTATIMEGFNVIIQMCVMGGLLCAAPFILYFVGQFVAPALTKKELSAVLPVGASALVLFLSGAAFAFFFLVPSTVRMSIDINVGFGYEFRWTVGSYYSILSWLVLGVGGAFEFPLLIVIAVWLGIVSVAFLRKYRRHAVVVVFVIAAIVTPTPDPFTQSAFAVPLYLLYEAAIFVSARIEKRKKKLNFFNID